ncbi:MAG: Ribonuclease H [Bacteroidetes bacterium ADurb.Bin141]|nr:MAG: Ribonuclease H [Bacteroidetes bacterium ADurb.Bin141]
MAKKKFYVVWKGRENGVFSTWEDCRKQVEGFTGALYKSFETEAAASDAFAKGSSGFNVKADQKKLFEVKPHVTKHPVKHSIAVDGAWNTKTLDSEYRGVEVSTGKQLFIRGPFAEGTNNIMEFLALVHALAYCKKHQLAVPIYSDSVTAMKWVRDKHAKTKLESSNNNAELFDLIDRAEKWLKENTYSNPVLKWETKLWGENPADFGRK